jgi:osmotically-inducible protein OsmY
MNDNRKLQRQSPDEQTGEPRGPYQETASDLRAAREINRALYWSTDVPRGKISVRVENNQAILEGEVFWNHERRSARNAACIDGITGVLDNIRVVSEAGDQHLESSIRQAFAGNDLIDERTITVKVHRNNVTLTGKVSTKTRKDEAGRISEEAAGVSVVDNQILVRGVDGRGHTRFLSL